MNRQLAAAAVGGVAHHRMIHMRAMHPDLMGAPGVELETQQRIITEALMKSNSTASPTTTPGKTASKKLMTQLMAFAISH